MLDIAMNTRGMVDSTSILAINNYRPQTSFDSNNINNINSSFNHSNLTQQSFSQVNPVNSAPQQSFSQVNPVNSAPQQSFSQVNPVNSAPQQSFSQNTATTGTVHQLPVMQHQTQKGQKVTLSPTPLSSIDARFGWSTLNGQCDVDVSAFLLGDNGKVLGDDWFVFYGQDTSPDMSTSFSTMSGTDLEQIHIDLTRLDPRVKKIVFVLTINDAFSKRLNFSMLKDAYIRIIDSSNSTELASFIMPEYYSNVISMTIGEVYNHNGTWKFNAIGNGLAKDLEGLCEFYGVQVSG